MVCFCGETFGGSYYYMIWDEQETCRVVIPVTLSNTQRLGWVTCEWRRKPYRTVSIAAGSGSVLYAICNYQITAFEDFAVA